jgi:hypothetical protein
VYQQIVKQVAVERVAGACRGPGPADRSQLDLSLEATPDHDQDQAHRDADDHGDETSIGQEEKILFLNMIIVAAPARAVAMGPRDAERETDSSRTANCGAAGSAPGGRRLALPRRRVLRKLRGSGVIQRTPCAPSEPYRCDLGGLINGRQPVGLCHGWAFVGQRPVELRLKGNR